MHDLPRQGLLQQLQARTVTGEHLEVLGKQAAANWGSGRCATLTDAIVQTVKHAGLSPEQVRRVVEFTNTEAFTKEFRKESAAHHVVNFAGGPADASVILKDLNDGGGGAVWDRGLSDYNQPPAETKIASAQAEEALFGLFSPGPEVAEVTLNPYAEVIETTDKLGMVRDRLSSELSGLEVMFHDLDERLYGEVKQAAMQGVSLGDILQAWQTTAPDVEYIKAAFAALGPRLLEDGIFQSLEDLNTSVEKTAAPRMVNLEHPLITEFSDYCEVLCKLAETRATRDEVLEHLGPLWQFLKEAAGGVIPAAWQHYKGAIDHVGKHVGDAAEWLANNPDKPGAVAAGTNKAVQFLGKRVAPALAAHHVYKNYIEPNALYQGTTNALLPNTPGTQQYYGY